MANLDPKTRRQLRQALGLAEKKKRTAAAQLFNEILEEHPDLVEAWNGLGTVLTDVAAKKAAFGHALKLDPEHAGAKRSLAILNGEIVEEPIVEPENETSGLDDAPVVSDDPRNWPQSNTVSQRFDAIEDAYPEKETSHAHLEYETTAEGLVCYKHGNETNLRCYSCAKPICGKCSKVTPVGYRCLDCIRDAESVFFDANGMHYLISVGVALFLGAIAGFVMSLIGFWIVAIFLGSGAGTFIGNMAFRLNGRHRGRYMAYAVSGAVLLSGAPFLFANFLGVGIYLALAVSACYYQLR